jgi:lipopolysaccharide biosynthesis glycosyltransferase
VVILVAEGESGESMLESEQLNLLFRDSVLTLQFVCISNSEIEKRIDITNSRLPHATYLRLWIPEILSDETFAVYIDVDIWIERSIEYLLFLKPNRAIAAHHVYGSVNGFRLYRNYDKIYFSTGTMVMNLNKLRDIRFLDKTIVKLVQNPNLDNLEMDAMNLVLGEIDEVDHLSEVFCWHNDYPRYKFTKSRDGIQYHPVAIIHFNGPAKPWTILGSTIHHLKWRKTFRASKTPLPFAPIDLLSEQLLESNKLSARFIRWVILSYFSKHYRKFFCNKQIKNASNCR